jgi:hypothetical protein
MCALTLLLGMRGAAARPSAAPATGAKAPVTVADLNLLHGLFCQPDVTDWCHAPARVEILGKWLEKAKCPDLVGLQEINARTEELINDLVKTVCGGAYTVHTEPVNSPDREMILTRLEVIDEGYLDIANFPWEAYWVRVDSPQGTVDFLTTHFASSSNNPPCTEASCPPVCAAGIETNECHAHELVDFFDSRPKPARLSIIGGDLNARPTEQTLTTLHDAGFVDTWVEAGRPECDPATGVGCTGCSEQDRELIGMDTVEGLDCDARIDFILVRTSGRCDLAATATGFAHKPLKQPIDELYWPSDHHGVRAGVRCTT